ncbi:MAG: metallophosphoesterase [Pseudomonadota bacterium]
MLGEFLNSRLFRRSAPELPPIEAESPIYVIGDVHGRDDVLVPLIDQIMQDAASQPSTGATPQLVFVGDMVDRGPGTRGVIEFLMAVQDWPELETHFLVGNHELMMLQFINDPVMGRRWLRYGGYETVQSYDIGRVGDLSDDHELRRVAETFQLALGPHLAFIEDLKPWHLNGNLLITHAGADPGLSPAQQTIDALVWGVPSFYQHARTDGLWVVHGHTIVEEPLVRDGRISVDTGAYQSGTLTALKVYGTQVSFLSETGPAVPEFDDYLD